jgi:hypothetical protein
MDKIAANKPTPTGDHQIINAHVTPSLLIRLRLFVFKPPLKLLETNDRLAETVRHKIFKTCHILNAGSIPGDKLHETYIVE